MNNRKLDVHTSKLSTEAICSVLVHSQITLDANVYERRPSKQVKKTARGEDMEKENIPE